MNETKLTLSIVEFGPLWLVGKKTTVAQGKTAEKFVAQLRVDGTNTILSNLESRVSPPGDIIVWMGEYDNQSKTFSEIPGVFVSPGAHIPEGFDIRELPHCMMGICTISGATRNLSRGAHNKLVKLMKNAGYVPDYSFGYSMEYYSYEKYEKDNGTYEFSYYLPCKPN